MENKNAIQGFTLIELLIVIAIIGILAAVLIPSLLGARKRAYDTASISCAKSIQTAEATYQVDKFAYIGFSKTGGTSDNIVVGSTDTNGVTNSATSNSDALNLGVSRGCADSNITIAGAGVSSSTGTTPSTYSITVKDMRGTKTYTVTPESLTGS